MSTGRNSNFATFIDSTNDRAPVAQRGKAKQKRYDLRLVGLGLVATRDGGVPLLSRVYPGNRTDVTQFTPMVEELARRYATAVDRLGGITLTFDAGQNSEPNFTRLAELNLHFVGSVPPSDHPKPLTRPALKLPASPETRASGRVTSRGLAVCGGFGVIRADFLNFRRVAVAG